MSEGGTSRDWLADGRACLDAALRYESMGWSVSCCCPPDHVGVSRGNKGHVHDCDNPGKVPWHQWKRLQDERLSAGEVRDLWNKVPASNVGIFTGPVSGVIGIDVDGPEGEAELARASGGDVPLTLEFSTGKGRRLLYALPAGVELRTTHRDREARRPLSFLAKGSQTVMPPSRHQSGRRYEWAPGRSPDDLDAAPAPAWLLDALRQEGTKRRQDQRSTAAAPDTFPEGSRDASLASFAGTMRRRGASEAEMYAFLAVMNSDRCEPPLPDEQVRKIARSVAGYAAADPIRVEVEAGRHGTHEGNGDGKGAGHDPPRPPPRTGVEIIVDFFHDRYRPDFKRGNAIHCADGRVVPMTEAVAVPTPLLIERLAAASNAPRFKGDAVNVEALPAFFTRWAKVAWGGLLESLREEDDAVLAPDGAAGEEFRQLLRCMFLTEFQLGRTIRRQATPRGPVEKDVRVEVRSLINWCQIFAKEGPWKTIRSKQCWCKLERDGGGELTLRVAFRHGLLSQLRADVRLARMPPERFGRLARQYGAVTSGRAVERVAGQRVLLYDQGEVDDLIRVCPDDVSEVDTDRRCQLDGEDGVNLRPPV